MSPEKAKPPGPVLTSLGELIRRKRRGSSPRLSQQDVAALFDVHQSTVAKWERGDAVNVDRLDEIAEWLGIGFEEAFRASRTPATGITEHLGQELASLSDRLQALEDGMAEILAALAPKKRGARAASPSPAPKRQSARSPR